jgi:hypothetical protein
MEVALSTLEKALAFMTRFMTTLMMTLGEPLVLVAAGFFSFLGYWCFTRKDLGSGFPLVWPAFS